jgi:hypothetical protein
MEPDYKALAFGWKQAAVMMSHWKVCNLTVSTCPFCADAMQAYMDMVKREVPDLEERIIAELDSMTDEELEDLRRRFPAHEGN